jgi:SAM-dependent methyltransferase
MITAVKKLLRPPEIPDLSIDDPRVTHGRREIIRNNTFLYRIYDEWYSLISESIPEGPGGVVELGSGAGFLNQYIPGLITSDVFTQPDIQVVLDARKLPFSSNSLKAIVMVDVLHHIPDNRAFLAEAQRCLRPGGRMVMIEPWVSAWSKLIYRNLHHEPFEPGAKEWTFPDVGPLSGANGALPWIIFQRDRKDFEENFSDLEIQTIRPFMPFRYLVSGGVSMRQLMPQAAFPWWHKLESLLGNWAQHWSMFALIHVRRR